MLAGPMCFVAGTQVLASDDGGTAVAKAIEDIEVGDEVWARDEFTGEEGFKPVVRLFRNEADTLVHLTYTTGSAAGPATLTGTEEHPFLSVTRNAWVPMAELEAGEHLLLAGGQTATATSVRTEHLAKPVKVYNFEVADWHTYHVGSADADWVFVHNQCAAGKLSERLGRLGYDRSNASRIVNAAKNGEQVVVVGENMRRVRAASRMVKAAGGRPVNYVPRNQVRGATRNALEANRSWIRYWAKDKGTTVLDIGRQRAPRPGGPSPFYGIENRSLNRWGIYTPFKN